MNDMLSQYVSKDEKDWDRWLPSVLFAYRTAIHSSTGKSPFELLYGRIARLPIELKVPIIEGPVSGQSNRSQLSIAKSTIERYQEQARDAIRAAQQRQKFQYDKRATVGELQVGDRVILYTPVVKLGRSSKFLQPWGGTYLVISMAR